VALLFAKTLMRAGHVRSFRIGSPAEDQTGWEISEQADRTVVHRQAQYDWHHVERALAQFNQEVAELRRAGWQEA
jgi:hypothetical protein